LAISFDPEDTFWRNIAGPVPDAIHLIKALGESLPAGVFELSWTKGKKGVEVVWLRGENKESVGLCSFRRHGEVFADTSIKHIFTNVESDRERAFGLLEVYVRELADTIGCGVWENNDFPDRFKTWSLGEKKAPPNLKFMGLQTFKTWPEIMQRFKISVEQSEAAELAKRKADYELEARLEAIKRAQSAGGAHPPKSIQSNIDRDLGATAPEGTPDGKWVQFRERAGWIATLFVQDRINAGTLLCDACGFDPVARLAGTNIRPRSALDVHHKNPLAAGKRDTVMADFALLCPTCHRIEHLTLSSEARTAAALIAVGVDSRC